MTGFYMTEEEFNECEERERQIHEERVKERIKESNTSEFEKKSSKESPASFRNLANDFVTDYFGCAKGVSDGRD